jgi:5-methylcytosine-specific restriction endonuclease McrA
MWDIREYQKNYMLERRKKNPEHFRLLARLRYKKNPKKRQEHSRSWEKRNPGRVAIYRLRKKKILRDRVPKWLSKEDKQAINQIYLKAKELGMEVDHIIPLRGETVSGLHVPSNLQILSRLENRKKSNKINI